MDTLDMALTTTVSPIFSLVSKNLRFGALFSMFVAFFSFAAPGSFAAETTDQKEAAAFLQNQALDAREEAVQRLLRENLELETMGRFVLGPEWRKASDEQRTEYLKLFSEFVVTTYSRRLGEYGGQQFEVTGTSQAGKSDALVVTSVSSNDGSPPVQAGWRVKTADGGRLKIVDVVVEGVSMLQTQRSEFDSVVRRSGLEGLMDLLKEKLS